MLDNDFICVPIPADLYQAVAKRYPDRVSMVFQNVLADFLDRTKDDLAQSRRAEGIHWGPLLLENGTRLRCKKSHSADYGMAEVVGSKILYEGKVVRSPSRLARRIRGNTSVNAWKHIEIMRPSDTQWRLADQLRLRH